MLLKYVEDSNSVIVMHTQHLNLIKPIRKKCTLGTEIAFFVGRLAHDLSVMGSTFVLVTLSLFGNINYLYFPAVRIHLRSFKDFEKSRGPCKKLRV